MSTTLIQSASATFPDRGAVGLTCSLASGGGGAWLSHGLEQPQAVLHVRWMICPFSVAGGAVTIVAGFDDAGDGTFRITFDPDALQLTVELATGHSLIAVLPAGLDWHAVELSLDTINGDAALYINGVQRDAISGSLDDLATLTCWFGVILKHVDAIGEFYLDEWVIADAPIGPVRVEPRSDYADDPARWLVVYNTVDPDSIAWAQRYRDARNIPYANLLGLELSTSELIDATAFADLNNAIEQYLADTGLNAQVMGILLGYHVPGYVDFTGSGTRYAIDDLLHRAGSGISVGFNANAADALLPQRPTKQMLGDDRLTARMDGPDIATVDALISRADDLMDTEPGDGLDSVLYLDPFFGSGSLAISMAQSMVSWSQSLDCQRLRLPLQWSGPLDSTTQQYFDAIHDDGFFWGWGQPSLPEDFFASPAGRRMACVQFDVAGPTATSVRSALSGNWITAPLAAGYAAAAAASKTISVSSVPYPRPFFEALRNGWTLAEAMYVAKPLLRDGLYLVGDPLLRVNLPKAGWDVFGPFNSLEQLNPQQPSAALRLDEQTIAISPSDGFYVVRQVDEHGRQEAGLALASVVNQSGVAAQPILPPIWPSQDNWPLRVRNGQIELILAWDRSLESSRVQALTLCGEVDGGAEAVLATLEVLPRTRLVRKQLAMPEVSARYRWRITSTDGAVWLSPWSVVQQPRDSLPVALQTMELSL